MLVTRCEYCGQLYDELSCPFCLAPRANDSDIYDAIFYADNEPYLAIGGPDVQAHKHCWADRPDLYTDHSTQMKLSPDVLKHFEVRC